MMSREEFKIVFAINLIFYRTKRNISCEELSLKLGKDKDFIYNLEHLNYEGELDTWTAMCIAELLDIKLNQLVVKEDFVTKLIFGDFEGEAERE